jgi:hypothetical protein
MRIYQMRVYTLASDEALEIYRTVHYPRHLTTFASYGVGVHGLWTAADGSPVLHALISYAEGEDPEQVTGKVMSSAEFEADMEGFDRSAIVGVSTVLLNPSAGSPLL